MDHGDIGRRRIAESLRASPVFAEVEASVVETLAAEMGEIRLTDGQVLFEAGDTADAMYLVISGALHVLRPGDDSGFAASRRMGRVLPGEPVGEMALLVGGYRSATARALGTTLLARIPASTFEQLVEHHPELRNALEREVTRRLRRNQTAGLIRRYFGSLDDEAFQSLESRLEWHQLKPGEILFDRGDPGDSLYIMVSGQLRILSGDAQQGFEALATVRAGEMVGEMGVLRDQPRTARVVATHASSLLRLTRADFEHLSQRYSALSLAVTRQVVERLDRAQDRAERREERPRAIAVVRAGETISPKLFLLQLEKCLAGRDRALILNPAAIGQRLGRVSLAHAGVGDPAHLGLGLWLDQQEAEHDLVFYLTDPAKQDEAPSGWTQRCLERADEILVLADSQDSPVRRGLEKRLYAQLDERRRSGVAPRVRLVLFHPEDTELPTDTARWLTPRRIDEVHHLRAGDGHHIERLARRLTGRAIGLALSGGGARGIAHIGVIRALEEAGIPVDMIAGSSIGGVVGALYAREMATPGILAQAEWSFVTSDPWREYTLPTYSILRSRRLDHVSYKTYGEIQVEDLWRDFCCVSTNISRQLPAVHHRGPLWRAVRATAAIPGLVTPVIMNGEIHVDGGVLNNVPGDLLRPHVQTLITVDVRAQRGLVAKREDFPSPWPSLWRRGKAKREVPTIMEILMDSVLSASDQAATDSLAVSDLVFTPPLANTTTLRFKDLPAIERMGYDYARGVLDSVDVAALCQTGRA